MSKFIIPLFFLLAGFGIVFILIIPGWQHFLAIRAENKHLDDSNTEIDALTQKRDALVNQINGITKDNVLRLDQIVPIAAHGPEFLMSLQKLALAHDLRIARLDLASNISTKPKNPAANNISGSESTARQEPVTGYQTINVVMETSGQYQSFKDFLHELESSIRITNVETLSLAPKEDGLLIKLSLSAFYQ